MVKKSGPPQVAVVPANNMRYEERATPVQEEGATKIVEVHTSALGTSGTRSYSGYPAEEYFDKLRGHRAADFYDKMRRGESQIKMVLTAVMNIIKGAEWKWQKVGDAPDQEAQAEFLDHVFFKDMARSWSQFIQEAGSLLWAGHSVFEVTHKIVLNHSKFGSYNGIKCLGWRSPRTILKWNLNTEQGGGLLSVTQLAQGDLQRNVDIPAEFLLVMSLEQEGDNYEGISGLRACYGPWFRKQEYLAIQAIGAEKCAIPTPVGTIPDGKQNTAEGVNFKAALANFTAHESNFIVKPSGEWAIDWSTSNFDPEKLQKVIDAEDRAIVKAWLANFLELGQSSSSGSWALSTDQSDFFLSGIEHIAKLICEEVSRGPGKQIIDLNYGPQEEYPQLTCTGISDKAGKELAECIKSYVDGLVIIPDDELEAHVRKLHKLPKASDVGQRKPAPQTPYGQPQAHAPAPAPAPQLSERLLFAEKEAKHQIKQGTEQLLGLMRESLGEIAQGMIAQVMSAYRRATPAERVNAAKGLQWSGLQSYRQELVQELANISGRALKQVRKEVPKANPKLTEGLNSIQLDDKLVDISMLPISIQNKIKNKASMLSESQLADLEKAVVFQFSSSVDSTDSYARIEADLMETANDWIEKSSSVVASAGNAAAHAINDVRGAFFFDEEVLTEVDSFTFVNGDPVSPICQDLAGTTFAKDDPDAARYFPPLHHNCKSYIVANLVGAQRSPSVDPNGLKPSNADLEKYVTLQEH